MGLIRPVWGWGQDTRSLATQCDVSTNWSDGSTVSSSSGKEATFSQDGYSFMPGDGVPGICLTQSDSRQAVLDKALACAVTVEMERLTASASDTEP